MPPLPSRPSVPTGQFLFAAFVATEDDRARTVFLRTLTRAIERNAEGVGEKIGFGYAIMIAETALDGGARDVRLFALECLGAIAAGQRPGYAENIALTTLCMCMEDPDATVKRRALDVAMIVYLRRKKAALEARAQSLGETLEPPPERSGYDLDNLVASSEDTSTRSLFEAARNLHELAF